MPSRFTPPPSWSNQPPPPKRMDHRTKRALWVIAGFVGLAAVAGTVISPDAAKPPAAAVQAGDTQRFVEPPVSSTPAAVAPVVTTEATTAPAATLTTIPVPATTTARPKPSTARPTTAKPRTTAPKPKPTTKKPKPKPTTEAPSNTGVHPGAFCSQHGEYGTTVTGKRMRCKTTASDSRYRWRAA